ncbi:MAG TPA: hypothetical protein VGB26_00255 [Nitrospiria bacterium]
MFKVHTGQGSRKSHSVVEAFEVLEVPAKSSSSFPNVFIGPACRQAGIQNLKFEEPPSPSYLKRGISSSEILVSPESSVYHDQQQAGESRRANTKWTQFLSVRRTRHGAGFFQPHSPP